MTADEIIGALADAEGQLKRWSLDYFEVVLTRDTDGIAECMRQLMRAAVRYAKAYDDVRRLAKRA